VTDLYHGQFCRAPLHPGPCKGWKKGNASAPTPAKKAAPAAPKKAAAPKAKPKGGLGPSPQVAPKYPKTPAQSIKQNSKIGKPSKTGKADIAIAPDVMEADWKAHNDSLTVHQRKAVNLYSTGVHHYMNRFLRTRPGDEPEAAPQTGYMKGLDLAKESARVQDSMAPAPRGTKVYRGMGFRSAGLPFDASDGDIRALAGKTLVNDGFTSTSVNRTQAFQGFERGIEMELEVPKGTPSLWLNGNSDLPWESELLLASGAKIEVQSITKTGTGASAVWKMKARVVQ
jgi:hypothetical protein